MATNLYIPKKLKIGFQKRQDTYTGKLAYVIYYDDKNKLRKESSWQSWRHKSIEPIEVDNVPMSGFLFNKGVERYGYHWGSGRSYIRIYDPRDFEFEISVDNLIGILMHSDVSKRDIVEECIYAWAGTELVLLPVNSDDYQKSLTYTAKQHQKISAKELVKGYTYIQKKSDKIFTYIGYFEWFEWDYHPHHPNKVHASKGKKHVFHDEENFVIPGINTFSAVHTEEISDNYADLVDKFFHSDKSQPIVGFDIVFTETPPLEGYENWTYQYFNLYKKEGDVLYRNRQTIYKDPKNQKQHPLFLISDHNGWYSNSETKFKFEFTDGLTSKYQIERERGGNSWSLPYFQKLPAVYDEKLLDATKRLGYDINDMTPEKVFNVLVSEGYGNLVYILENGTKIPVKL